MENDLKVLKVEYLSNHLMDHTQMFNLSLDGQTIFTNPSNEDALQWERTSDAKMTKPYFTNH
jgi:hypothetical protein